VNPNKALFLCAALAAATVAAAQPAPESSSRGYQLQHLDSRVAATLFWELCPPEAGDRCEVLDIAPHHFRALAPASVHREMTRLLAERDVLPGSQRLQLHLLTARREGQRLPADLTAGARRALEDLAAVLAYRSFDLLDSAVVETVDVARVNLAGPGGVVLDASLRLRAVTGLEGEKLHVDLSLVATGAAEQPAAERRPPFRPGPLLNTSLSLEAGETVVVGTSRLGGGVDGLVLLLTALP
jgi:hypothetical protein